MTGEILALLGTMAALSASFGVLGSSLQYSSLVKKWTRSKTCPLCGHSRAPRAPLPARVLTDKNPYRTLPLV